MIKLFVPAALAGAAFLGLSLPAQAADCAVKPVHKPVMHKAVHKAVHKAPARKVVVKKVVHKTVIRKAEVGCGCGVPARDPVRHPVIMRPDGPYFVDGVPRERRVEVREIVVTPMRHERHRHRHHHHHHPRW